MYNMSLQSRRQASLVVLSLSLSLSSSLVSTGPISGCELVDDPSLVTGFIDPSGSVSATPVCQDPNPSGNCDFFSTPTVQEPSTLTCTSWGDPHIEGFYGLSVTCGLLGSECGEVTLYANRDVAVTMFNIPYNGNPAVTVMKTLRVTTLGASLEFDIDKAFPLAGEFGVGDGAIQVELVSVLLLNALWANLVWPRGVNLIGTCLPVCLCRLRPSPLSERSCSSHLETRRWRSGAWRT